MLSYEIWSYWRIISQFMRILSIWLWLIIEGIMLWLRLWCLMLQRRGRKSMIIRVKGRKLYKMWLNGSESNQKTSTRTPKAKYNELSSIPNSALFKAMTLAPTSSTCTLSQPEISIFQQQTTMLLISVAN